MISRIFFRKKNPLFFTSIGLSQPKLHVARPDVCAPYVYPLVGVIIRKYASACEVLHDNRVRCLPCVRCCTLYRTCLRAPSCDCARCTKKQADISSSSHQTAPEGAVRQQLFVYLDLTCNYVHDRLHHVEKDIFGLRSPSQLSKGARCPTWLQLCTVAVPSRSRRWDLIWGKAIASDSTVLDVSAWANISHDRRRALSYSLPLNVCVAESGGLKRELSVIAGCCRAFVLKMAEKSTNTTALCPGRRGFFLLVIETVCKCPSDSRCVPPHLAFISSCDDLISLMELTPRWRRQKPQTSKWGEQGRQRLHFTGGAQTEPNSPPALSLSLSLSLFPLSPPLYLVSLFFSSFLFLHSLV